MSDDDSRAIYGLLILIELITARILENYINMLRLAKIVKIKIRASFSEKKNERNGGKGRKKKKKRKEKRDYKQTYVNA